MVPQFYYRNIWGSGDSVHDHFRIEHDLTLGLKAKGKNDANDECKD